MTALRPTLVALASLVFTACGSTPTSPPVPVCAGEVQPHGAAAVATVSAAPSATTAFDPNGLGQKYVESQRAIVASARGKRDAWEKLRELTDGVGHRLSGSPELDRAIEWGVRHLKADGHENVHTEKVMVPRWDRGRESAELVAPTKRPLAILGLGGTVGTPAAGIEAEVVVVRSWDELEKAGERVKDKIVLFDVVMPYDEEKGPGYGEVVGYRGGAASRAAKLGAKAVLVRSLATASLYTPHTGAMKYEEKIPKIPAASISVEDSAFLARKVEHGETVRVRLKLGARDLPEVPSANVVAELVGREKPDEVVLIGAHLDSWDVGQGAHDDGAGCVIVMQALTTLRALPTRPRRTVRVVLFTNEENGLRGGKQYAKDHEADASKIVAALESDFGGFAPDGFTVEVAKEREAEAVAYVRDLTQGLDALGPLKVVPFHAGADISPLMKLGTPGVGFMTKGRHYFDLHHSEADTLDKVDPKELADDVAAVAGLVYALADAPKSLRDVTGSPP